MYMFTRRGHGELGAGNIPGSVFTSGPGEHIYSVQTAYSVDSGPRAGSPVVWKPRHNGMYVQQHLPLKHNLQVQK